MLKVMKQKKQQSRNGHDSSLIRIVAPIRMYVIMISKQRARGARMLPAVSPLFQVSSVSLGSDMFALVPDRT